jgi:YHS domain-containing protein
MKPILKRGSQFLAMVALAFSLFSASAFADMRNGTSAPAMGGYDPVSYFESDNPIRGNDHYSAVYNGGTYLFVNKTHKKMFEANPKKYAPQFGGYCAYGVAKGKKFYSDPTTWAIINRKLYLNLDKNIQKKWSNGMKNHIAQARTNWKDIEHKDPSEL